MFKSNGKVLFNLFFVSLVLNGCGPKYEYWDISKFNIDNKALADNEEVKIIYSSRGPDFNKKREYYIHLVAVSQKTGDTVNILTPFRNDLNEDDKDKIFNFFSSENISTKLLQLEADELMEIKSNKDIDEIKEKKINKVARDPSFDYVADNLHPSIIGTIGEFKPVK